MSNNNNGNSSILSCNPATSTRLAYSIVTIVYLNKKHQTGTTLNLSL